MKCDSKITQQQQRQNIYGCQYCFIFKNCVNEKSEFFSEEMKARNETYRSIQIEMPRGFLEIRKFFGEETFGLEKQI